MSGSLEKRTKTEHEASSDPSARLTSIFQRKHPRDVANCPVGISNDLSDEVDDAVRDFTSSETSGGGSYEPPTEFRTDGTLEASNSGLRLLNSLFSHSGTCKDVSGAMDYSHQQKKCFKMKKPWICGEIHGKTVYKIENRLGFGGCGWIFRASRQSRGKWQSDVVVKVCSNPDRVSAHEREAHTYFTMPPHDNVLTAEEVVEHRGQLLLVLPYANGGSLADFLRRGRPSSVFTPDFLIRIDLALQLCRGLAHLHMYGLVHQDMKPGNVLLFQDSGAAPTGPPQYKLRLSDFGLTTRTGRREGVEGPPIDVRHSSASSSHEEATFRGGTPAYMAPEQRSRSRVTPATDLWSVGIMLFELLMRPQVYRGKLPTATDIPGLLDKAASDMGCELLWAPVIELVRGCLAVDVSHRPSAQMCVDALERLVSQHTTAPIRQLVSQPPESRLDQLCKESRWLAFFKHDFTAALPLYLEIATLTGLAALSTSVLGDFSIVLSACGYVHAAVEAVVASCSHAGVWCEPCSTWLTSVSVPTTDSFGGSGFAPSDRFVPKFCGTCVLKFVKLRSVVNVFHHLCRHGTLAVVQAFVEAFGGDECVDLLSARDVEHSTCLHAACANRNCSVSAFLLELPVVQSMARATTNDGSLPLRNAIQSGCLTAVRALLELAPETILSSLNDGTTPLQLACQAGFGDIVSQLIKCGAPINEAAAFTACSNGHWPVLDMLFTHGLTVHVTHPSDGSSLLIAASSHGHTDIIHELLSLGVDVNHVTATQKTALHFAAGNGYAGAVRALLRAGCFVNCRTKAGESPLFMAAKSGHHTVVADLLKAHASPDTPRFDGATALVAASRNGHVDCVKELLSAGASCSLFHLPVVQLPLYLAARHGHLEVVKLLLSHGARADCFGQRSSILHVAAMKGHAHVCVALLDAGAPVDLMLPKSGFTPLHLAADNGHSHVVRALLSKGANANTVVPATFITPLMLACRNQHVEVVKVLLSAGADPALQGTRPPGFMPLHVAMDSGNEALKNTLLACLHKPQSSLLWSIPLPTSPGSHADESSLLTDITWHATVPDREEQTRLHVFNHVSHPIRAPVMQTVPKPLSQTVPHVLTRTGTSSTVFVRLKLVYWPGDPVQRQEHHEILPGPVVLMGRSTVASKASKQFPSPFTYFSPRDTTVERYLSSHYPQLAVRWNSPGFDVTSLIDPGHPVKKPVNPLLKRCQKSWVEVPPGLPIPLNIGDEFMMSTHFGFKVVMLESAMGDALSPAVANVSSPRRKVDKRPRI